MCTFHEMGEAKIGDIPTYSKEISAEEKDRMEEEAVKETTRECDISEDISGSTLEFNKGETLLAKVCKDMDYIDMILQADFYQRNANIGTDKLNHIPYFENGKSKMKTQLGEDFLRFLLNKRKTTIKTLTIH